MAEFPSLKVSLVLVATFALSGCSAVTDYVSMDRAKSWYEKKCETFEDYMAAAQEVSNKGNYTRAMQYYKDGRALAVVLYGESDGRVATSSSSLAHLEENAGNFTDAESDYKKALEIDKKILGWDKPETVELRRDLARVLRVLYKEDEAKQVLAGLKDVPAPVVHSRSSHSRRK